MIGDNRSWLSDMIEKSFSFRSGQSKLHPNRVAGKWPCVSMDDQHRDRFLREMAGIDPAPKIYHVKKELNGELEVIDENGRCFYVPINSFSWQK
jgi:hypothetical protein